MTTYNYKTKSNAHKTRLSFPVRPLDTIQKPSRTPSPCLGRARAGAYPAYISQLRGSLRHILSLTTRLTFVYTNEAKRVTVAKQEQGTSSKREREAARWQTDMTTRPEKEMGIYSYKVSMILLSPLLHS